MAQISRSTAALRVMGESLNPKEICDILGCDGTMMYSKGDIRVIKKTGDELIRKSGMWLLKAKEHEPENLDGQILEILAKLNSDVIVWQELSSRYAIDLFCGLFMEQSNEGMDISPTSLKALGDRGIMLALDVYDPCDE